LQKKTLSQFQNSNANEMNRKKQNQEKEEEECICKLLWVAACLHRKRPYTEALLLYLIGRAHCRPNSCLPPGSGGRVWPTRAPSFLPTLP